MDKKSARLKRALKLRSKIKKLDVNRLTIHRTSQHIYAQVFSKDGTTTLASASTAQADVKNTGNTEAAIEIGKIIAQKAVAAGVTAVSFDRSGFKYHGRVKALANAAREAGLKF